jgi:hypothetical protein
LGTNHGGDGGQDQERFHGSDPRKRALIVFKRLSWWAAAASENEAPNAVFVAIASLDYEKTCA